MKVSDDPIIIEQLYSCSTPSLWNALTDVDQMRQWLFDNIPDFKAEVGFKTQFVVQVEERTFTHLWEITEVLPHQKITFRWKYVEYPGECFVTFELTELENLSALKLSTEVVEDFPDYIPEFSREKGVQGWKHFIQTSLKEHLDDNL